MRFVAVLMIVLSTGLVMAQEPMAIGPVQVVPTGPDFTISNVDNFLQGVANQVGYRESLRKPGSFQVVQDIPYNVFFALIKDGKLVTPLDITVALDDFAFRVTNPDGVYVGRQGTVISGGKTLTVFQPGQRMTVLYKGVPILGNPNPNDPRNQIVIPQKGFGYWGIIDLDHVEKISQNQMAPSPQPGISVNLPAVLTDLKQYFGYEGSITQSNIFVSTREGDKNVIVLFYLNREGRLVTPKQIRVAWNTYIIPYRDDRGYYLIRPKSSKSDTGETFNIINPGDRLVIQAEGLPDQFVTVPQSGQALWLSVVVP